MTARLIKTAKSPKISHEIDGFLFSLALPRRFLAWLSEEHEGMISLVKRCHMTYRLKNYQNCKGEEWTEDFDSRKMEQFVCILIL